MMAPETENRIVKYLLNEATTEDLDVLSDWILVEGQRADLRDVRPVAL